MQYEPKSEAEVSAGKFLTEPGDYSFTVSKAEEKTSASGNDMVELILTIHTEERDISVYDYLVGIPKAAWKLRHFCASTGLLANYEGRTFNAKLCPGRKGQCTLKVQEAEGQHKAKMVVVDYIASPSVAPTAPVKPEKHAPTSAGLPPAEQEAFDKNPF